MSIFNFNIDLLDTVGMGGVMVLVVNYLLFQMQKTQDYQFFKYNAIGSFFIIINLLDKWNLSSFMIEFAWLMISLYGMLNFKLKSN